MKKYMLTLVLLIVTLSYVLGQKTTRYSRLHITSESSGIKYTVNVYTPRNGGKLIVEFLSDQDIYKTITALDMNGVSNSADFLRAVLETRTEGVNRWKVKRNKFEYFRHHLENKMLEPQPNQVYVKNSFTVLQ